MEIVSYQCRILVYTTFLLHASFTYCLYPVVNLLLLLITLMQVKRREAVAFVNTVTHGKDEGLSMGIDPHILAGRNSGAD